MRTSLVIRLTWMGKSILLLALTIRGLIVYVKARLGFIIMMLRRTSGLTLIIGCPIVRAKMEIYLGILFRCMMTE